MAHDYDPEDTQQRRSKRDRIARLRERLKASDANPVTLAHVMAGILDLLGDEL